MKKRRVLTVCVLVHNQARIGGRWEVSVAQKSSTYVGTEVVAQRRVHAKQPHNV